MWKSLSFSTENHNYTTRHAAKGKFALPSAKTNNIKRTMMYRTTFEWNLRVQN